jgi:ABC-type glycerol-3-phosphate transport system substrate-binding protein
MIKKIGIAVLFGVSALALAACGQQSDNDKIKTEASQPSVDTNHQQNADDATKKMNNANQNLTGQDEAPVSDKPDTTSDQ